MPSVVAGASSVLAGSDVTSPPLDVGVTSLPLDVEVTSLPLDVGVTSLLLDVGVTLLLLDVGVTLLLGVGVTLLVVGETPAEVVELELTPELALEVFVLPTGVTVWDTVGATLGLEAGSSPELQAVTANSKG